MQNEPYATAGAQGAASTDASYTTLHNGMRVPAGMAGIAAAYLQQCLSGANWFFWIAGLSLVNSVIAHASGRWSFLVGLGMTQVVDGIAIGLSEQLGGAATAVALVLDLVVAGIFVGIGLFARKGLLWAFVLGLFIYALDGLIFVFVQEWLSIAFHAFVIFRLYQGFAACKKLRALEAETMMA